MVPTAYSAVFMPRSAGRRASNLRMGLLWSVEDAAEHGDDHRHETGEDEGGQEAQAEREHDEDAGTPPVRVRADEPVGAQVAGDRPERTGERGPAVLAADGGPGHPAAGVQGAEMGPGLVGRGTEAQRAFDPLQIGSEWSSHSPAGAPHGVLGRRPGP